MPQSVEKGGEEAFLVPLDGPALVTAGRCGLPSRQINEVLLILCCPAGFAA